MPEPACVVKSHFVSIICSAICSARASPFPTVEASPKLDPDYHIFGHFCLPASWWGRVESQLRLTL